MKTGFSVTMLIRATPAQVFWFIADPATAQDIDPRRSNTPASISGSNTPSSDRHTGEPMVSFAGTMR
jgi:hypothetical protein